MADAKKHPLELNKFLKFMLNSMQNVKAFNDWQTTITMLLIDFSLQGENDEAIKSLIALHYWKSQTIEVEKLTAKILK